MRTPTHCIALAFLCGFALSAHAAEPTRYLQVANHAHDSVVSLETAGAGSNDFRTQPMDAALRGGGDSATFAVGADQCRYDVRVTFADRRTVVYQGVDLCRGRTLALEPPSRLSRRVAPQADTRVSDARD